MACMFCRHWRGGAYDDNVPFPEHYTQRDGQCTLNPQWEETKAEHYCGHLALTDNSLVARFRDFKGQVENAETRDELKRVRKVAKELRRQVRDLKQTLKGAA